MFGQRCYVLILIGFCFTTFTQFGFGVWTAPFLGRIHHLNTAQIGTTFGLVRAGASLFGTLAGGYLSDWMGRKDVRWRIYVSAICSILAFPGVLLFVFAKSLFVCTVGFTIVSMMSPVHVGPIVGATHSVVKVGMRAFSTSIVYLISELIGLGLGSIPNRRLQRPLRPTTRHSRNSLLYVHRGDNDAGRRTAFHRSRAILPARHDPCALRITLG